MLCRPNKLIQAGKWLFLQFKRIENWVSDTSSLFRMDQTSASTLSLSSLMDKLFSFHWSTWSFLGEKDKGEGKHSLLKMTLSKVSLPLLIMMIPSAAVRENWIFFTGDPKVYMEVKNSCFPKVTNGIEPCCAGLRQSAFSRSIGTI